MWIDEGLDISVHVLETIKRRTSSSRRVEDTVTCANIVTGADALCPSVGIMESAVNDSLRQ